MDYKVAKAIEFVLSPERSGIDPAGELSKGLTGDAKTVKSIPTALRMQATLSGPDFEVSPSGPQQRTVLPTGVTRWAWTVRPLAFGDDLELTLEVAAILEMDGKVLPPSASVVLRETIPVDVHLWDRISEATENLTAMHGLAVAIGTTLIAILSWLVTRWRKKKADLDEDRV